MQEILYWQSSTVQMMYTIVADAIKAKGELPLMPSNPPPSWGAVAIYQIVFRFKIFSKVSFAGTERDADSMHHNHMNVSYDCRAERASNGLPAVLCASQ